MSTAPSIVTRTLTLASPADPAAIARLGQAEGVVAVAATSVDGRRLAVTYDVRAMVMGALVKVAAQQGLVPATGLAARLARALAGFQDDNLREQAGLVHKCCSGMK